MKKLLAFAFLIALVLMALELGRTFGLLETRSAGTTDTQIGRWNIKLNDIDIILNNTLTADDLIYSPNPNVEPGYFAPGVSASYQILIDPSNTDVAVRYDIKMDMSSIAEHSNIQFEVSGDVVRRITPEGVIYTGIIPLNAVQQGQTRLINTYLVWDNDEDFDELDNRFGEIGSILEIKISITFSQYLGEPI